MDNSATTSVAPEVKKAMLPYLDKCYGNPSSLHRKGVEAEKAVKNGRRVLSRILGIEESEIIFTSGATESDNLAIKGIARAYKRRGRHILTTAVEHEAVLEACKALEREDFKITKLNPDKNGRVSAAKVTQSLRKDTILLALMHVNNELGTITLINEIAEAVKQKKPDILVFSDGAQAFGKLAIDMENIDLYAISGHKIHAPKGIGALVIRKGIRLEPLLHGGGQERALRAGTENVPGIVGLARAARLAYKDLKQHTRHIKMLKKRFLAGIGQLSDIHLNSPSDCLETIVNIAFEGIPAEVLLHALEEHNIYVSTGSACSTKHKRHSHVLEALGLPEEVKRSSLRFGFSRYNHIKEIDYTIEVLKKLIPSLRSVIRRSF